MRQKKMLKENVQTLMNKLEFPMGAQMVLVSALERIVDDAEACSQLDEILAAYDKSEKCNYGELIEKMKELCEGVGVHEYASGMLMFLCMGEKLRKRYAEKGISEQIFYDTIADLKYKLEECRLVKHEVGSFVASWFAGFFDLTRFALGRLQFEIVQLGVECEVDGIKLSKENKAINMHIPRTGTRLNHDEVVEAYRRAAEFFHEEFDNQPVVFTCSSWLLDPWHEEVLAPESNLMAFYKDFKIVSSGQQEDYSDSWRLFDCEYPGAPEKLPQDSSLRRAYVERMKKGEPLGWGQGVFLYK